MPNSKRLKQILFKHLPGFRLDHLEISSDTICARLTSVTEKTSCPKCHSSTTSIHSHYQRSITDLPWGTTSVTLNLRVRRFRCKTRECTLNAFCERFPKSLERYARKTYRYSNCLKNLAATVGGKTGARLSKTLHLKTSASTILRHLKAAPALEFPAPKVIGVDDFAYKRGQTYGTLIVDLERSKPIDLLKDRTSSTLEAWLKQHPSVEIISRDRATEYAKACDQGAPNAVQVLDRWHVLKNLREALERVITRERKSIKIALETGMASQISSAVESRSTTAMRERSLATREERATLHAEIHRLIAHGVGQREMAIHLGVSRELIRRYARSATPPNRRVVSRKSKGFGEFEVYMLERWAEGCRNAMLLWREIRAKGFRVAKHRIAAWMRQRRAQERAGLEPLRTKANEKSSLPSSPKQLVWLMLKETDSLEPDEQAHLTMITQACPVVLAARDFALEFQRCVRSRDVKLLEDWFSRVALSDVQDFKSFAKGFDREKQALFNALELRWSNGPVEGRVNKLKLIKRQGYGRSGFELLRLRVLHVG